MKQQYEVENNPKKIILIKNIFIIKKSGSMDEYLINMKDIADMLEHKY